MSTEKARSTAVKPLVFEARPRVSIDGFAFPEAYAYLTSIPPRQVNRVFEALILRALVSMQGGMNLSTAGTADGRQETKRVTSDSRSVDKPAPSTALATGDLSAFGDFDSKAFDYTTR